MRTRQRKRSTAVIERCVRPGIHRMAQGAFRRKGGQRVIWILCAVIVLKVALNAILLSSGIFAARMTLSTSQARVSPGKLKACGSRVAVTFLPPIESMARIALGSKSCSHMVYGTSFLVVGEVAGGAIRTEAAEQAGRFTLMTVLALQRRMRSHQRKTVRVPVRIHHDLAPPSHIVALFAIASVFTPMDIRMTGGALFPDGGEDQLGMALPAIQTDMHSFQRESCSSVAKVGKWPDWFETC